MSEIKKVDESAKVDEFAQPVSKKWKWLLFGTWIAFILLAFVIPVVRYGGEPQTVGGWPWYLIWVFI